MRVIHNHPVHGGGA